MRYLWRATTSFLLSILLVLPNSYAGPLNPLSEAQITQLSGTVEALDPVSGAWRSVVLGQKILPSTQLRAGSFSSCQLKTPEGHELTVYAETQLTVSSLGTETDVHMDVGILRSKVAKLKGNQKYSVHTPTAVAAVRGTEFDVLVARGGATEVRVLQGIVNFSDLKGLGGGVDVMRNQRSVVQPGAPAKPPQPLPTDTSGSSSSRQPAKQGAAPASASGQVQPQNSVATSSTDNGQGKSQQGNQTVSPQSPQDSATTASTDKGQVKSQQGNQAESTESPMDNSQRKQSFGPNPPGGGSGSFGPLAGGGQLNQLGQVNKMDDHSFYYDPSQQEHGNSPQGLAETHGGSVTKPDGLLWEENKMDNPSSQEHGNSPQGLAETQGGSPVKLGGQPSSERQNSFQNGTGNPVGNQPLSGGSVPTSNGSAQNPTIVSGTSINGLSGGSSVNLPGASSGGSNPNQVVVSNGQSVVDNTTGLTLNALFSTMYSAKLNDLLAAGQVQSLFQEGLVKITPDGILRLAFTGVGKTGDNAITYFNASKKAGQLDLSYEKVDMTFNSNIPSDYTQATSQALRSLNGSGTSPSTFLTGVATERGHTTDYNTFDKVNVSATKGYSAYNTSSKEWRTAFANTQASMTPANGTKTVLYNKVTNTDGSVTTSYLGGALPTITIDNTVKGGFSIRNDYADGTRVTQTVTHFDSLGNPVSLSNVPTGTSPMSYLKNGVYALDSISCSQFKGGPIENLSSMNARISGGIDSVVNDVDATSVFNGNAPVSVPTGVLTSSP